MNLELDNTFFPLSPQEIVVKRKEWVHQNRQNLISFHTFTPQEYKIADTIVVGSPEQSLSDESQDMIYRLMPWRKGPFQINDLVIESEWRSDLKWSRLDQLDLEGKAVCDIGCNNGYFMYRMIDHGAKLVVGLDPVPLFFNQFRFIQSQIRHPNIYFEPVGIQDVDHFLDFFDCMFCLGILYHHTDPVGMLRKIKRALKPGGQLVVDCQSMPGEDSICLVPKKTYAGAHGIWFLPTAKALEHWLSRAGFRNIDIFYHEPLATTEQRQTPFAPYASLAENLDPQNSQRTREGYPAPWRTYVSAMR